MICNFVDLPVGSVFVMGDTKTYVKTGGGYYSPLNSEILIVPQNGVSFVVAKIDQIEIFPPEKVNYSGFRTSFHILAIGSYFLQLHNTWEVFKKVSSGQYVDALRNLVREKTLQPIVYNKWTSFDVVFIHDNEQLKDIESRTWQKNQ